MYRLRAVFLCPVLCILGDMKNFFALMIICWLLAACQAKDYNFEQTGLASYYADFFTGRTTASGDTYHPDSLTAAHKHLPLGTKILVTNLENQEQLVARVNDRGPYHGDRILDLSKRAADSLNFKKDGLTRVKIQARLSPSVSDSLKRVIVEKSASQ